MGRSLLLKFNLGFSHSITNTGERKALWLMVVVLLLWLPGRASITIDSVTAQRSNCANDGIITVYARSSNPPLLYAIISGPLTRPYQNTPQFGGIPPGNYTLAVVNFSGDSAAAPITVTGNYKFPDFTIAFTHPLCSYGSDGTITGTLDITTGRPPYRWELTQNSNGQVTQQTSGSYTGLKAGSYSLRLYDSCQSFTTKSVTLVNPDDSFYVSSGGIAMVNCDTALVTGQLSFVPNKLATPITIKVQTAQGTYQYPFTGTISQSSGYMYISEYIGGVSYGDWVKVTVIDACGRSVLVQHTISDFTFTRPSYSPVRQNCQISRILSLRLTSTNTVPHGPLTMLIRHPVTGAIIDSLVYYNGYLGYLFGVESGPLTPDSTYKVTISDTCGNTYTQNFTVPATLPRSVTKSISQYACRDSTASVEISAHNFPSGTNLTMLSGPPSIHSTKVPFTYNYSMSYGVTYISRGAGILYTGSFYEPYGFINLGVGTYVFQIADSCGNVVLDSLVIRPQDVADLEYKVTADKACPGQNQIYLLYNCKNGTNNYGVELTVRDQTTNTQVLYTGRTKVKVENTLYNVSYHTYAIDYVFDNSVSNRMHVGPVCTNISQKVTVPSYAQPAIKYVSVVKCNGQVIAILNPDSTKGLTPYRYELISGPQVAPLQRSNVFLLPLKGSYTARVIDTCGNAQTFTFVVDTIFFPPIGVIGKPCVGQNVILYAESSPFFKYTWQLPNGSLYVGDSLRINPLGNAGVGQYRITRQVNINSCVDTLSVTYSIDGYLNATIDRQICAGKSITIRGHTYTTTGVYRDTFATVSCDSIITLNLLVKDYARSAITQTICAGQNVRVGTHTYSATGTYRDTLSTANCDSIVVLSLLVSDYLRDTTSQTICKGQSVQIGSHVYRTTGAYRDTFSTVTCDSIHLLQLLVEDKEDSVSVVLCEGDSITVGAHTYRQTGIYRDTIATASCDSIHILNLTVSNQIVDSVAVVICTGSSVTVGTHTYTQAGVYRDTFAISCGDSIHILNLSVSPLKYTSFSQTICKGQSVAVGIKQYTTTGMYTDTLLTTSCDSIVALNLTVLAGDTVYTNGSVCEGRLFEWQGSSYGTSGTYVYTKSTPLTCDTVYYLYLQVMPAPTVVASSDKMEVNAGDTIQLNASPNGLVYIWSPPAVLSNPAVQNPTATIQQDIWLYVTGTDTSTLCSNTDSVFVQLKNNNSGCDSNVLFIPSGFTPNNDGLNDKFKVYFHCGVRSLNIKIFDRIGEMMFESEDPHFEWDGSFKGRYLKPDVFVYVLITVGTNGEERKYKGSITLIR